MKKCKHCQSEIDEKAKVCPKCQKKQGVSLWLKILLVIIFLCVVGSCGTEEDTSSQKSNSPEPEQEIVTTAKDSIPKTTTTTKSPEILKQEFISECQSIAYKDIARNPDNYKGTKAVFTGEVIQVQEGLFNSIVMRVNVTKGNYDIWDDTVYVNYTYSEGESKFLEDDIITMYGTLKGSKTYTTVLGSSVTIPQFDAKYINLN